MVGGFAVMYQILDRYVENDISEIEHAFVMQLKWDDSYKIKIVDEEFWGALQRAYDIVFTDEGKKGVATVGDLKRKIRELASGQV